MANKPGRSGNPATASGQKRTKEQRRADLARLKAEEARKSRQRKLLTFTGIGVVLVLVAVGVAIAINHTHRQNQAKQQQDLAANSQFIPKLSQVPAATFDAVGVGSAQNFNSKLPGPLKTENGLPKVTYIGTEWCPNCSMQRWSIVTAFSRFGQWKGLEPSFSAENDGNVPSVTFKNATYTSKYFVFSHFELEDRDGNKIKEITPEADAAWGKVAEAAGGGRKGYPATNWAGVAGTSGAQYQGAYMMNADPNAIAAKLNDPNSPEAKGIIGGANVVSAQLCQLTKNQPANVCNSAGVKAAATRLYSNN